MAPEDDPFAASGTTPAADMMGMGGPDEFEIEIPPDIDGIEGIAEVQCVGISKEISKSSGQPMWVWDFLLIKYTDPDQAVESQDIFKVFTSLSRKALWKMAEVCEALYLARDAETGAVKFKRDEAIGRVCEASMKITEFNGRSNLNIDALRKIDGGAVTREITMGPPAFADDDIPF